MSEDTTTPTKENTLIKLNANDDKHVITFKVLINEQIFDKNDVRFSVVLKDKNIFSVICVKEGETYSATIPNYILAKFNAESIYYVEIIFNNYYFKPLTGLIHVVKAEDVSAKLEKPASQNKEQTTQPQTKPDTPQVVLKTPVAESKTTKKKTDPSISTSKVKHEDEETEMGQTMDSGPAFEESLKTKDAKVAQILSEMGLSKPKSQTTRYNSKKSFFNFQD